MTAPRFENVLSIGNIIQIIVILVAMVIAWGDARNEIDVLKSAQAESLNHRAQLDARLRAMEMSSARSDERIDNLLRSMEEVKLAQRETNALLRRISE
jgi:hypothetical protein